MQCCKAKINGIHAFLSSPGKACGALTDSNVLPLIWGKMRLNLQKNIICMTMNISELKEGGFKSWFPVLLAQLFSFSPGIIWEKKVNASPTTQVNTLYILEFPTKLLTIAMLCLPLPCVSTKWEKVWVARKWDCSVVQALKDNIENIWVMINAIFLTLI